MVLPCPECCDPTAACTIHADLFDGDLSAFTTTGSPSVAAGLLEMSSGDKVVFNAEPTLATDGTHVATTAAETASGTATMRLFAARDDDDNLVFGELAIAAGAGTIRVGKRVGAAETWLCDAVTLRDDTELTDPHALALCWKPPQSQEAESGIGFSFATEFEPENAGDWADAGNATGPEDNSPAEGTLGAPADQPFAFRGFSFNVPPSATIDGILVSIRCRWKPLSGINAITLSSLRVVGNTGTPSGDDKGGATVNALAYTYIGGGGATDDWSAGLTGDDFSSGNFAVTGTFSSDGNVVLVDCCHVTVWYTGADQTLGRVTLTYTNTEIGATPAIQCAIGTTDYEATGKGTGASVSAGDWEFADLTASYLDAPGHTPCPTCECPVRNCKCCTGDAAGETGGDAEIVYLVSIGSGWTDNECDSSDEVPGDYEVVYNYESSTIVDPDDEFTIIRCVWLYSTELTCGVTLSVALYIMNPTQGGEPSTVCEMNVQITAFDETTGEYSVAQYRYTEPTEAEGAEGVHTIECRDDEDAPWTLDFYGSIHSANSPFTGDPPATITVDIP